MKSNNMGAMRRNSMSNDTPERKERPDKRWHVDWTAEEKDKLYKLLRMNYSSKGIATVLGRTHSAVKNAIKLKIWRKE